MRLPQDVRRRLRTERRRVETARRGAWLSSWNGPGVARCSGLRISYTDPIVFMVEHKDIFWHGIYDFDAARPEPLVLDCGSHIGMSILRTSQRHPDARIVGFEPDPAIFSVLETNVATNHLGGVELHQAAVAPQEGTVQLLPDGDAGRIAGAGGLSVPSVTLSSLLADPVDFLKMNIEGVELEVLREAADRLRLVEQMVIEYHGFAGTTQYLHDLLALLHALGYRYLVHDFDAMTNATTKPPFHLDADTTFFLLVYAKRRP